MLEIFDKSRKRIAIAENASGVEEERKINSLWYGNEFVPYVVLTEKMLNKIQACTYSMDIFDQVAKMTTNYRVWEKVTDYLVQCFDIITDKVENAKAQG